MNLRVMVVDDEPIAAQATSLMITKASPGLEVAALCYSGREAINKAFLLKPDIIIMDIQMPGINGLDAIKRIKESNPDTRFIILSAYGEFSYAVKALSLGACDYLLKPVKQSSLTIALQKVQSDILGIKEELDFELQQRERLEIVEPMIRRDFIRSLLPETCEDERLIACASFLNLSLAPAFMMAFSAAAQVSLQAIQEILERLTLSLPLFSDTPLPGITIVYIPASENQNKSDFLSEFQQQIEQLIQKSREDITAGMGEICKVPIELKSSVCQALGALEYASPATRCIRYDAAYMKPVNIQSTKKPISTSEQIINRAIAYIKQNFKKDITLDEVANYSNLSPYYFCRLFKEYAGTNYGDYLLRVRIEKAKELLVHPEKTIKEVSFQVGYNDPNYFSKVFHKTTGIKASDYRIIMHKPGST